METTLKRKYISITYTDETQLMLRTWCQENGFDLTKKYNSTNILPEQFKFHTTVFYSNNISTLANDVIKTGDLYARATGFKMLGEKEDVPVLTVDSSDLQSIRRYYLTVGLTDAWPVWIPHVSLSYADGQVIPPELALPSFDLYFDKLSIEDVEDEI